MQSADMGETEVVSHSEGLDYLDQLGFKTNQERKNVQRLRKSLNLLRLGGKAPTSAI